MRRFALTLLLALAAAGAAWAQEPTPDELKKENAELKRQLEALKQKLAEQEAAPPAPAVVPAAAPPATTSGKTPTAEAAPAAAKAGRAAGDRKADEPAGRTLGEVVVTATRAEADLRTIGSSISVVSGRELREQQTYEAIEPLRGVPGMMIRRTGTRGDAVIATTRGLTNVHTQFQMEGFELNNDGGVMVALDSLATDAVGGIEVLRGPQSGLYGSAASGGVVNFRLRRGEGPARVRTSMEYGTFNTHREKVDLQGGDAQFGYSLAASRLEQSDGQFDDEDYEALGVTGRFDYALSERTRVMTVIHANSDDQEVVTGFPGPRYNGEFDQDAHRDRDLLMLGLDIGHRITDWWDAHVQFSRFTNADNGFDGPDADPFGDFQSETEYARGKVHVQNRFYTCKANTVTAGVEFKFEEQEQISVSDFPAPDTASTLQADRGTWAFYLQDELNLWDAVYLTGALRRDDLDASGEAWTYRLAGAGWIDRTKTKIRASIGKGVVEPQFFQLFTPLQGNPSLSPEVNRGWDAGFDQYLLDDRLRLSATYFHNRLANAIRFRVTDPFLFTGTFENAGKVFIQGAELEAEYDIARDLVLKNDALALRAAYTWTDQEIVEVIDDTNPSFKLGSSQLDIPRGTAHFNVNYGVAEQWGLNVDVNYFGTRKVRSFVFGRPDREVADEYTKVDIAAFWSIPWIKGLRAIARGENVTHENYDESEGFPAPKANFLAGLEYEIRW
ncbi:MAG: TonB-dependent receptor [Planctomycetes bacterium]|nr:TonB-dependent receptor [Planctomycetota bacterium]